MSDNKDYHEVKIGMDYINYDSLTAEDFTQNDIYAYLYNLEELDEFQARKELIKLSAVALKFNIRGIKALYESYKRSINRVTSSGKSVTNFTDQPIELYTSWTATDSGISKMTENNFQAVACSHPITITKRICNMDTGLERLELAFKAGFAWRNWIADKGTLASANKITELANYGVSVTSENAKYLVSYLQELEAENYSEIETVSATSRLGWVTNKEFMPYSENVEFDGDPSLSTLFKSVHEHGDRQKWLNAMSTVRRSGVVGRIIMAASALSPLLEIIETQPSFVHVYSPMSGTGKTLLIMCAASFWGDPELGKYTQSFNATTVAMERTAETLNSLPMIVDELQLQESDNRNKTFDVYKLAIGLGKGRGTKTGGIERVATWRNTIITSGEDELVKQSDGQGAFARVLDLELKDVLFDFRTGNQLAKNIKENYGFGGKQLVEIIKEIGKDKIVERFEQITCEVMQIRGVQQKQVMLGAGLLLADEIISEHLFPADEQAELTLQELAPLLRQEHDTRVEIRAYDFIQDWIALNSNKLTKDSRVDFYGLIEGQYAYINSTILNRALKDEAGLKPRMALKSMAERGMITTFYDGATPRYAERMMSKTGDNARYVEFNREWRNPDE